MTGHYIDWKDVANSQFSKAVALTLTLVLFVMMVAPKNETKKQKFSTTEMELVNLPDDIRQKVEQPQTEVNVSVDISISDELGTSPVDIEAYEQAISQIGDIYSTSSGNASRGEDRPVDFVPYDDPPEIIGVISPVYPEFARKAGVQGTVILEVEVYRDGVIGDIRVKKSVQPGPGGLDEAAIAAVRKIRFQPGKSSGQAVDTTVIVPIEFTIN